MKKSLKKYLLLEQLEERIFLDANPVAALDPVEPFDTAVDPAGDLNPTQPVILPQPDISAAPQDTETNGSVQESQPESVPEETGDEPAATIPPTAAEEGQEIVAAASQPDSGESADNGEAPLETDTEQQLQDEADAPDDDTPEPATLADSNNDSSESREGDQEGEPAAVEAIDPMIGEDFTFTVTLNNTSGTTLYGPYIDLYMPSSGDDGDGDGVTYVPDSATYLGSPLEVTVQTFDSNGEIIHPYDFNGTTGAPTIITGTPGDTYVTIEMPFGSFTPDQPPAEVQVTAHIDEFRQVDSSGGAAEDFDIRVYNGYRYGETALNDPTGDPPTDPPIGPTLVDTQTFRPEVIRFEKVYLGPEQETATGPNYPHQYQITIDIADGQTINNLQLTELLPNEIYYLGDATVAVSTGQSFTVTSPNAAGGIFTDGVLEVELDNPVTGGATAQDVVITFDFYVPEFYADGVTPILDPATGDDVIGGTEDREVINNARVEGNWTPTDPDDSSVSLVVNAEVYGDGTISPTPNIDEIFQAEAIAVQKGVDFAPFPGSDTGIIGGYNPGDILEYTVEFQISDYFNFGDIVVTDILADGLELQTTGAYAPIYDIQDETGSWTGGWTVGTDLTSSSQADDDTSLSFDISAVAGGLDGILQGDLYDGAVSGTPAGGTITYYALIKDSYISTGDSSGPGDESVDQGDFLTNNVDISGQIYGDNGSGTLTDTGFDTDTDDSATAIQIEVGELIQKDVYAINGFTDLSSFTDAQGRLHMQPGDTVTYQLQYLMPTSEFESFRLDDYLPLPVFDADEFTEGSDPVAGLPGAGEWSLGPTDTFSTVFPLEPIFLETFTENGENRLSFVYGENDDIAPQQTYIDILFTVTVNSEPFADGLYLANQVRGTENGTPLVDSNTDDIFQIVLDQPVLEITKGIVESDNEADIYSGNTTVDNYFTEPGSAGRLEQNITSDWLDSHNIDTDISNIDAGDTITVAIVVENTGHSDAFDVTISDVLPTGYTFVALSLQATDGNGTALSYSGDLFGTGLILNDTVDDGALAGYDPTVGTNIMVITYDLLLADNVGPSQTLLNTATLENYGGDNGASNHIPGGLTDQASAQIPDVLVDKAIDTTSQPHTDNPNVTIGETITYTVAITLPEGQATNVMLADDLDPSGGLEIISLDSLTTASTDFTSSVGTIYDLSNLSDPNNLAFLAANGSIAADGLSFFVDFNTLDNQNRDNGVAETLTLTYTALVRNIGANQNNDNLSNNAVWSWTDGNSDNHSVSEGESVTIVEPKLLVSKSVDNPTPDEDDTVTFTIEINHDNETAIDNEISTADAFDVTLADTLPAGYDTVTITSQAGTGSLSGVSDAVTVSGNTLSGFWDSFELGDTYTITLTAHLATDPQAGENLTNTATIDWTSLPEDGDPGERTGTPATGDPDDYITDASAIVTVGGTIDKVDPDPLSYTIGEEVQYYILVTLPEGDTANLIVTDDLPAGMSYIDGSYQLFTQAGIGNDPSGLLAADFSGPVLPPAAITGGTANGEAVSFGFGTVSIAPDNDPGGFENDAFVIGIRALVLDVLTGTGNYDGSTLTNDTYMVYDNPVGGDPIRVDDPIDPVVTVIEPWIETNKDVSPTSGVEAGDTVTYTVTLYNGGNATAYEVNFNDTLAQGTTFGAIQSARIDGVDTNFDLNTATPNGDNSVITFADDAWDLAQGAELVLVYTATVTNAAIVDGSHTNTVDADWSSLDNNDPGEANERVYDENDGVDSPVDGGVNADRDVDTAEFTIPGVTIDKSDGDTSTATIGDTITYTLTIDAPEGTINNLVIEDVLIAGLVFNDDATISTASGSFSTELSQDPTFGTNDGSTAVTITWNLGDTIVDTDDPLIISYTARVANVSGNFDSAALGNTVTLSYDNVDGDEVTDDDSDSLSVVEPWIETNKDVSPTSGVEAGDTVTYTVTLYNGGNATAYEVNFNDTLAQGTAFGAIQSARIDGVDTNFDLNTATPNGDGSVITFADDAWDLAPGAELVLVYTATVTNAAVVDGSHTNTVDADWSSLDNNDPGEANERVYDEDDGVDSPVDDGLNAGRDIDTVEFTIPGVTIDKSDGGITSATIGDTITYTLTIDAPEGTINNLVIEDVLIAGLVFNDDATISTASGSFSTELSQDPTFGTNDGSATVTITWNLGDTIVDTDDPLIISYTARVANVSGNFDSTALGNTVTLSYDNVDGDEVTDDDTDSLSVVEPWIETNKDVSPTSGVEAGDTVTYTVTLYNGGNATAYEVNFNDTLAQGTTFGAIQSARIDGVDTNFDLNTATPNGDNSVITFADDAWDLAQGAELVLVYTATVTNAAIVDGSHTNTVDADWSSLDNNDPGEANERVYDENDGVDSPVDGGVNADRDVDTAEFTIPGVTIDKSDGDTSTATIGDTITYTLTIDAPEGTINNLVIEDVLIAGLVFNDDATISTASGSFSTELSQDPTFGTNDGSTAVTITWNLGDTIVDTDDPLIISYTARVANVSGNFDSAALGNTVTLSYDNVDGDEVTDDDTDSLSVVEPWIETEKSVADSLDSGTDAQWNETLTYTVRFTNGGNSTAYEVNALDTLAPGTSFVSYSSVSSSFGAVADPTMTDNDDGTVSIVGNWDIPVGEYVEIEYTVTVLDAIFLPTPHENSVDADWSGQDGSDPDERVYDEDDGIDSPVDDGIFADRDVGETVFTVITTSSIGDTVFFDTDQSGSETPGDTGITDILVTLSADTDGDGTSDFTWTDTTDENGYYLFENLPAFDNYTVTVDPVNLPDGTIATYDLDGIDTEHVISGIALDIAEARDDADFGYFNQGTGSIGDTVWYDADADGVFDAGEQGLGGVTLTLTGDITGDNLGDISLTTTTDENGNYSFENLLPGNYTVTIDATPAGMEQTFDLDGLGTPDNASIALADGENNNNVDFGYTGAGSIGDTIFFDADNSGGETPGDAGIPGITVTLTGDVNNDGIEDVLTTTTDADGRYLFENLRDGTYTVTVDPADLPGGMSPSADPDGGNDNTSTVILAGGIDELDEDFGYTGTGIIGDTIWDDVDGDGTQNGGETGLSGVDVTLSVDFDGDGTPDYTATTTTNGSGTYSFGNLPEGTYTISIDTDDIPDGYVLTADPDANPDSTTTVNLPAGGTNLDQDFGYWDSGQSTGSIGDTIYFDADGSGGQNGTEPGLSGVTVTLTGDIDGDGTADTVTTTTDSNGMYLFDNIVGGDYTIIINPATLPAGLSPTQDPDGGTANQAILTLAADEDNLDQDFGYNGTGSIGDTIFFDGNNNGTQETNEGGINGVQVTIDLDLDGDGVADYTYVDTTDADGNYLFENLPAGGYTVTVDPASLPLGIIQSSDPDSALDNTSTLVLGGAQNNLLQDFGYTGTGSIGDTIWNDTDGDGLQNGSETGIAGVDITITADIDSDGTPDYTQTVTTDSNGTYLFNNLPDGDYTLIVDPLTLPAGLSQSGDPDGTNDNMTMLGLTAGENNLDQDFGYNSGTGSIGDTIFFDSDGSGDQNGTETGLPGVSVTLTGDLDGDGTPDSVTTTTDANGNYLFDNLPAGSFVITVDPASLPAGMNQTADPDNDGIANQASVILADGEDNLDQDFGYQGSGSIGDTIWNDVINDGIQDGGEPGLPGIDVTLSFDFDGDGTVDYTQTDTTDASGNYLFENLPGGTYVVSVDTSDIPDGYVLTADPDSNPDSTSTVNLPAGGTNLDQDFGYHNTGASTGSIGDTIYFDENNNGTQDGSDVGLPGVTVSLSGDIDGDGTTETVTTTTDASGTYSFDNLPAGDYTITVDQSTLPGGMSQTEDPDGVNNSTTVVSLGAGEDNDEQDFGYTGSGVIGDTIYFDTDGDGTQDAGENGMPGIDVTISVDFDGDGTPDYTATVATDAAGTYSFDNLPAGEYTISVDPASLPADVRPSGDPDGTPDNSTTLNLGPGAVNNDQDFGYTGTGSIGDTIYFDADGNGYQSSGERGLSGVRVTLQGDFDNDGTIEAVTTTTDATGTYLFDNLTAGQYTVYVDTTTLPPDLTQTGDPDAILDNQSQVTLAAGENDLSRDFGYFGPSPFPGPRPPDPGEPVVPITPPSRPPSPGPVEPPAQGLVADAFFMYRQFGDQGDIFTRFEEQPWLLPPLPVSPIYSGLAEPGTTIELVLHDAMGNQVGYRSVMADTAGNWLADLPETIMFELPHHMEIGQTISSYNASSAGFFNMRTYFYPSFSSMVYSSTSLDVETVFAYLPSTVLQSMHQSNLSTFDIRWDGFKGYEFDAPSTQPARNSH